MSNIVTAVPAPIQRAASSATAHGPQLQSRPADAPQAFFGAARNGDVGLLVELLGKRQASAAAVEAKSGMTALMLASMRGHAGVVSLLIDRRDAAGFINACDARGYTALFLARVAGYDEVAALTAAVSLSAGDAGKVKPVEAVSA